MDPNKSTIEQTPAEQPQEGQAAAPQEQQNSAGARGYRVITPDMLKVRGLSFRSGGGGPAPIKLVKSWSELEQPKVATPQAAAPQEQQNSASEATAVAASEIDPRFRWPMPNRPYRNSLHYKGPPPIWAYDSDSSQSSEEEAAPQEQQNPAGEANPVEVSRAHTYHSPRYRSYVKGTPPSGMAFRYTLSRPVDVSNSSQSSEEKDADKRSSSAERLDEPHAKRVKETVDKGWIAGK